MTRCSYTGGYGQLIDVIADGLPIERGQAVVVTKTRGNRVLVRAVDSA